MKRKLLSAVLLTVFLLSCFALTATAENTPTVSLRIEGITQNLYYADVEINNAQTVADIIIAADKSSDKITVTGAENSYITDINGESAGSFGGWDGWSYTVNGQSPSVGIGDYNIKSGDIIVVFYSDSFGVGIQYPVMDDSKITEGIITFTSTDTTYDENFNPTTAVNPVADMKVIFDNKEFVTDKQGSVVIPAELLTAGDHSVSVSKVSENGIPLVLRLAPNTKVTIPQPTPDEDGGLDIGHFLPLIAALVIVVICIGNIVKNNKNKN